MPNADESLQGPSLVSLAGASDGFDGLLADLSARFDAGQAETFAKSPRATVLPAPAPGRAASLGALQIGNDLLSRRLRIESTLGAGGMGIVRLAEQTGLGRRVAVKTLHPDCLDPVQATLMLQEAWIVGALEHPNIVPVHDLFVDEQGRPHIVLKRIEGSRWADLMHNPRELRTRFDVRDPLEWNLGVLLQLCQAVAFAHDRGFIHRDLKPENVMIGAFGEVVLLDWGIALALTDDGTGRFPLVGAAHDAAGTPAYMAPEMLGGTQTRLSKATDVYLLGAVLYEISEGRPPHEGASFPALLTSILASNPEFTEQADPELVKIVRRAMSAEPSARFASVMELKATVDSLLRLRGARRLVTQAERRREQFLTNIADGPQTSDPLHQNQLHALFAECRFAYMEALRAWPEHREAARGLHDITTAMVEYQLSCGQPQLAAASLATLSAAPVSDLLAGETARFDLKAKVEVAVGEWDKTQHNLQALRRDHDPATGLRTRSFLSLMFGLLCATLPYGMYVSGVREEQVLVLGPLLLVVIGMGTFGWAFDSLTKTSFNRFLVAAATWTLIVQCTFSWVAQVLRVPPALTFTLTFPLWAMCAGFIAFSVDRRIGFTIPIYALGLGIVVVRPEWRWIVGGICNLAAMSVGFAVWSPFVKSALSTREKQPASAARVDQR